MSIAVDSKPDIVRTREHALVELFVELDHRGISYAVLRGFESLSVLAAGSDVDLYVPQEHFESFAEFVASLGWLERSRRGGVHPHVFFDRYIAETKEPLVLDIVTHIYYGAGYYKLDPVVEPRLSNETIFRNEMRILSPWLSLILLSLHIAIDKGELADHNRQRFQVLLDECRSDSQAKVLYDIFGPKIDPVVDLLSDFIISADQNPEQTFANMRRVALESGVIKRTPMRGRYDRVRRMIAGRTRPKVRVAVMGMDGSGKSTLVETVTEGTKFGTGYLGYNQFRTKLAKMLWLCEEEPTGLKRYVWYLLRMFWWPIEVRIRMFYAERGRSMVLYDRYPLSVSTRVARSNDKIPIWKRAIRIGVNAWNRIFIPRPDMLILCDGDPEVIWNRKREMPYERHLQGREQLQKQFDAFRGEKYLLRTDLDQQLTAKTLEHILIHSYAFTTKAYKNNAFLSDHLLPHYFKDVVGFAEDAASFVISSRWSLLTYPFQAGWQTFKWLVSRPRNKCYVIVSAQDTNASAVLCNSPLDAAVSMVRQTMRRWGSRLVDPRFFRSRRSFVLGYRPESTWTSATSVYPNGTTIALGERTITKHYHTDNALNTEVRLGAIKRVHKSLAAPDASDRGALAPRIISTTREVGGETLVYEWLEGQSGDHLDRSEAFRIALETHSRLQTALQRVPLIDEEKEALSLREYIKSLIAPIEKSGLYANLIPELHKLAKKAADVPTELGHGDYWIGNLIVDQVTAKVIDFDRVGYFPKWYDAVHLFMHHAGTYIATDGKGLHAWVEQWGNSSAGNYFGLTPNRISDLVGGLWGRFVEENAIDLDELRKAEVWYLRLQALYRLRTDLWSRGVGTDQAVLRLLDEAGKIEALGATFCESFSQ